MPKHFASTGGCRAVLSTPSGWHGFTLIELMVVIAILGILATMALPTYHDRIIRTQIEEARELSQIARRAITSYHEQTQSFPVDNRQADIPEPRMIIGNYVKNVTIQEGAVHVRLGNRVNAHVDGRVVSFRPAVVEGSPRSPIAWLCGNAEPVNGMQGVGENLTTVPERYLPIPCRSWLKGARREMRAVYGSGEAG